MYSALGVKYEMLIMGKDGIISGELQHSEATVLHVTPFNSFPSNVTADVSKRNEYIKWAQGRNGYIIEDNYGSELTLSTKAEDTVFSMTSAGNVIYINTFSKTIAPSIRVGYMVLPENLLERVYDRCIRIPMVEGARSLNLSNSVAIVTYEALRQHEFEHLLDHGALTGREEAPGAWMDYL